MNLLWYARECHVSLSVCTSVELWDETLCCELQCITLVSPISRISLCILMQLECFIPSIMYTNGVLYKWGGGRGLCDYAGLQ